MIEISSDHSWYYTPLGVYDFYGIHLDGADVADSQLATADAISYDIEIDGTQDVMIAKAILTDDQKTILDGTLTDDEAKSKEYAKAYSSYTARRNVQPEMEFQHLLSRLKFNIYPANANSEKVFIKSIEVKSQTKGTVTFVAANDADRKLVIAAEDNDLVAIALKQKPNAGGNLETLVERVFCPANYDATEGATQTAVPVGESLLLMPADTYDITITTEENVGTAEEEDWREGIINRTLSLPNSNTFKAGYSYNIAITIAALEEIQITASLKAWEDGGDIELGPDDEF